MGLIFCTSDLDCPQIIDDVFEVVCQKNTASKSTKNAPQFMMNKKCPEIIFKLCDQFKLALEARYFAVELFNDFATAYIQQYGKRKDRMLAFCSNSALYILVCIQISSKMSSHYKAITQRSVINHYNIASGEGRISRADVMATELEILQIVNYDLNFLLPNDIIDILLFYVQDYLDQRNPRVLENCEKLKETCASILEMVYLRHDRIMSMYSSRSDGKHTDNLLLSIAVICVAIFIVDDDLSEVVAVYLSEKCSTEHGKVLKLSVAIIENVYKDEQVSKR